MTNLLVMAFFVTTPSIVFLFLLWAPTVFVVLGQKSAKYPRAHIFARALGLELSWLAALL